MIPETGLGQFLYPRLSSLLIGKHGNNGVILGHLLLLRLRLLQGIVTHDHFHSLLWHELNGRTVTLQLERYPNGLNRLGDSRIN